MDGRVFYKNRNIATNGTNMTLEYGYNFYDIDGNKSFIPIGLYGDYYHMIKNSNSNLKIGDIVNANQIIGKMGNTGVGSAAHLHFGLFTRNNEFHSDSTMRILLGKSYNTSDNILVSSIDYWEKEFWNSKNQYSWNTYRTAYNPELYWINKLNKKIGVQEK